jgi:hypothetical protein
MATEPLLLRGFQPVSVLWEGDNPPYPSQQSALWAVRQIRRELAAAEGIALHRGRTMINLEKLAVIVNRLAIEKAKARCGALNAA